MYKFISDSGHGWLEVDSKEIIALGIERDISAYSYVSINKVYLEEDCDIRTFLNAKVPNEDERQKWFNENVDITNIDGYCFVRKLPQYSASVLSHITSHFVVVGI